MKNTNLPVLYRIQTKVIYRLELVFEFIYLLFTVHYCRNKLEMLTNGSKVILKLSGRDSWNF